MGTNFYWRHEWPILPTGEVVAVNRDSPVIHIGKRSAAGPYCWDCGVTLCKGGERFIHYSQYDWWDACPQCGQQPTQEGLNSNPAGVELGFAQPRASRPTGVRGCSSFSWAQDPERVKRLCEERADDELIEDEYGEAMTGRQFLEMVTNNCPVQYTDSVGTVYS